MKGNSGKVTLYLMTIKGYEVLRTIIDGGFASMIAEVVIGRDDHLDNDYADELERLCLDSGIRFYGRKQVFEAEAEFAMAVSWRWLIPVNRSRLIVFHDSLLPGYRGFAPLVSMLLNRESRIGVSAIVASDEYDRGAIIAQSSSEVRYPIRISDAISLLNRNYTELAIGLLKSIQDGGEIITTPQDESKATYSLWRDEEDYQIDWRQSASDILHFINVVSSPYQGASSLMAGKQKIRILRAEVEEDVTIENRVVGKVIFVRNNQPVVVCGSGLLRLTEAIDDVTGKSVLPFRNFRVRLT